MKSEGGFVYLSAAEMSDADKIATEEIGIEIAMLMENAGLATASVAREMLGGVVNGKRVSFLIGKGNNGGDGLVAARRLHGWGAEVRVVLGGGRAELREKAGEQLSIIEKIGLKVSEGANGMGGSDLLVDALLGYNAKGNPKEPMATLIRSANKSGTKTLAVDIPSGLDSTTGEAHDPCVVASATVSFGFLKTGFLNPKARSYLGDLYLADISFPQKIYQLYGQSPAVFGGNYLVRII